MDVLITSWAGLGDFLDVLLGRLVVSSLPASAPFVFLAGFSFMPGNVMSYTEISLASVAFCPRTERRMDLTGVAARVKAPHELRHTRKEGLGG